MTFAQAAQKAIELGGKYDGHELPEDINNFTKTSATALVGPGPDGASARDAYPRDGQTQSYVAGFAEVEVDVETGKYQILDYTRDRRRRHGAQPAQPAGADRSAASMLGIGHAHHAEAGSTTSTTACRSRKRFYQNKPPTILDAPLDFKFAARRICPIRKRRSASRGVGEPPVGAAYGAIMNAIAAAVGDEVFRRSPVTADMHSDGARERRQARRTSR